MKTSELIKKAMEIEGINDYRQEGEMLCFYASKRNEIVAYVNLIKKFKIATDFGNFSKLPSFSQELLLDLFYEYAKTPLEEREEPKKYKLRHKLVEDSYLNYYLGYIKDENELRFSNSHETDSFKTAFTIQEWESLTEQTWEDLLLQFKAIEV